jgi:two-component system, sensor histidine kinase and response regulator
MSNYSILVIDDEPGNFEVIEALLPSDDYVLNYASRGQEGIANLDAFDPDVILLDVMMPEMDGFEVCQRIKAMPQWQAVPIIMVTALSSKEDLARCLAAGADDFICKPVNSIELRARVKSMLRIKKQHDRIQSLCKLQRNNIHTLENSLNEFRLDLAVGFPNELNITLNSILDNVGLMQKNIGQMSVLDANDVLELVNQSALRLDKLNQKFLFYLQLALAPKDRKKHQVCAPKMLIKQIAIVQASQFKPSPKLIFDIQDPDVAVTPSHLQYIVNELLDNALTTFDAEIPIYVHGQVIDDAFHFWIDGKETNVIDKRSSKLSELIRFDAGFNEEAELDMGLKIVKKIIEIYDGLFLIANTDRDKTTIYVTLPLAMSQSPQLPVLTI